jgi:integrase
MLHKVFEKFMSLYSTTYTIHEAKMKMLDYQAEMDRVKTFREIADTWKDEHFADIELGTQICYKKPFERVVEHFGDNLITDIDPVDIKIFLKHLADQDFGKQSVRVHRIVLKLIFDKAMFLKLINMNPADIVKIPKGLPSQRREIPSDNFIKIVENNKDSSQMGRLAYFLLYTGLRKGEALALQWKDIDFEKQEIQVYKTWETDSNQPNIKQKTKSAAGKRTVFLLDRVKDVLLPHKGHPDEFVFAGNNGAMTKTEFYKRWRRYCLDTGMYYIDATKSKNVDEEAQKIHALTPHQLRHAYITMLYEAGIDTKAAMPLTGHATESVLKDIYTHIREKKESQIESKLNQFEW